MEKNTKRKKYCKKARKISRFFKKIWRNRNVNNRKKQKKEMSFRNR